MYPTRLTELVLSDCVSSNESDRIGSKTISTTNESNQNNKNSGSGRQRPRWQLIIWYDACLC